MGQKYSDTIRVPLQTNFNIVSATYVNITGLSAIIPRGGRYLLELFITSYIEPNKGGIYTIGINGTPIDGIKATFVMSGGSAVVGMGYIRIKKLLKKGDVITGMVKYDTGAGAIAEGGTSGVTSLEIERL